VMRLARQSFAGITIEGLRPGEYRELTRDELNQLKKKYLNPYRRAREASKEG
jgi:23S rRNA pseudouridine2605 synthase